MSTQENLKEAFAGESQANRRYLAFSRAAKLEGLENVSKLFFAAAEAETVHALNHLRVMGEAESTEKNLEKAVEGEGYEVQKMYPKFVEEAEQEGNRPAYQTFDYALEVEKIHHRMYEEALEAVRSGKDIEAHEYYICSVCGNTVEDDVPEICPICGAKKEKFRKAE